MSEVQINDTESNDEVNKVGHIADVSGKLLNLKRVFEEYGNSLTLGFITEKYHYYSPIQVRQSMKRNSAMSSWLLKLEKKGIIKISRHNPEQVTYSFR